MRKIEVPIIIIVIIGIIGAVLLFTKDKEEEKESVFIGVVGTFSTEHVVSSQVGNYYKILNSEKTSYGLINENDEVVLETKYRDIFKGDDDHFVVRDLTNEGYVKDYVIDLSGKVYLEGNLIETYEYDGKVYYFVENPEDIVVYDETFKEYEKYEGDCFFKKGYVFSKDKLYDVFNKKTYNYDKRQDFFDGTLFFSGDGAYVLNLDGELQWHKKAEIFGYVLTLDNERYTLHEGISVDKKNFMELNSNYKAQFDDECSFGDVRLYDKKGKAYDSYCYSFNYDNGMFTLSGRNKDNGPISLMFLHNGEIFEQEEDYHNHVVNKVIVSTKVLDNTYYDFDGNKLDLECYNLESIGEDSYACYDKNNKVTILDKNFKKINDSVYDGLFCEDYLCINEIGGKYGALYNGKVILDNTFPKLEISDNILFSKGLVSNYVIKLGTENIVYDIAFHEDKFDSIDVDKVISDYSLEEMEQVIKDNVDLFKKFAYLVINDKGLLVDFKGKTYDYRRYVFMTFKVFVDNKKYLDEYNMLYALKDLSFKIADNDNISYGTVNVAGTYNFGEINLGGDYKEDDTVIYHELMHMIDHTIAPYAYQSVYSCDNKIEFDDTDKSNCKNENFNSYSSLLVEGGAEYYSGVYLKDFRISTYSYGTSGIAALAYIYGDKTMRDVFFSPTSELDLFKLLYEDGMTLEEYNDFLVTSTSIISVFGSYNDDNVQKYLKYLIDIYKRKKGNDWYKDKEFLITLDRFVYVQPNRKIVGDDIADNLVLFDDNHAGSIISQLDSGYSYEESPGSVIRDFDGKTYYVPFVYNSKKVDEIGHLVIEFDPYEEKVISHKYYVRK